MNLPVDLQLEILLYLMDYSSPDTLLHSIQHYQKVCITWKQILTSHPLFWRTVLTQLGWDPDPIGLHRLNPAHYLLLVKGTRPPPSFPDLPIKLPELLRYGDHLDLAWGRLYHLIGIHHYLIFPHSEKLYPLPSGHQIWLTQKGVIYYHGSEYYHLDLIRFAIRRLTQISGWKSRIQVCRKSGYVIDGTRVIDPSTDHLVWQTTTSLLPLGEGLVRGGSLIYDIYTGRMLAQIDPWIQIHGVERTRVGIILTYSPSIFGSFIESISNRLKNFCF